MTITENGRRKSITKFDASIKQQVNKAASGDPHAFKAIMSLVTGFREGELKKSLITQADLNKFTTEELDTISRFVSLVAGESAQEDSGSEPGDR